MEPSEAEERKKTDDSWKAAAQKEKERLQEDAAKSAPRDLPPASFISLLGDLSFQAMLALGLIGPEGEKERLVDLQGARYVIDTLAVLEGKTKGNLTAEEADYLSQLLHNLRLRFVEISRLIAQQPPQPKGQKKSGIILDEK